MSEEKMEVVENQLDDTAKKAQEQLNMEFQELIRDLKLGKYGAKAVESFINTVLELSNTIKTK